MTWRAILEKVTEGIGWRGVTIVYTDDVSQKFSKDYTTENLTDDFVRQVARSEVARLNVVRAAGGKLLIGEGQEIDLTEPVAAEQTPEQVAQAKFFLDLRQHQQLTRAVEFGLIPADDPRVSVAQKTVQAGWQDSYVAML